MPEIITIIYTIQALNIHAGRGSELAEEIVERYPRSKAERRLQHVIVLTFHVWHHRMAVENNALARPLGTGFGIPARDQKTNVKFRRALISRPAHSRLSIHLISRNDTVWERVQPRERTWYMYLGCTRSHTVSLRLIRCMERRLWAGRDMSALLNFTFVF